MDFFYFFTFCTFTLLFNLTPAYSNALEGTIHLHGKYSWELILDVDNSQNDGKVRRTITIKSSITTSYKNLVREVQESSLRASLGFDVGGVIKVVNVGVKGELESQAKSLYEKSIEGRTEKSVETTKTDEYEVGPRSKLKLYRLVFNGPGISHASDTISTTPHPLKDVDISVTVRQKFFLGGIDVVNTEDAVSRPDEAVQEIHGLNPDINAGFGGKFVWLVPKWTARPNEGVTGVEVVLQSDENRNYKDLAKGAGGLFRYLKTSRDPYKSDRITKVGLYRTKEINEKPTENGWQFCTADINQQRKGDYLYFCWNSEKFD